MKILLITDGIMPYVVGGMQKHSTMLVKYLTMQGCDITLFHCVDQNSNLPNEDEVNELLFKGKYKLNKSYCLEFPSSLRFPGHYLYNSYKYSELILDMIKDELNSFDFIYAKGFTAWKLLSEKENGLISPPIGINFHGYEMWQYAPFSILRLKNLMLRPFVKKINLRADKVFSYGEEITTIIKRIGVVEKKIIEIPSGIDESWIRDTILTQNDSIKFLFIGRFERRKGINELNHAIKSINVENSDIEFHFIGPLPKNKKLAIKKFKIYYHGLIKEEKIIKNHMDNCDILICSSFSEGMPNVILEGMSRGMAIIASDVGATRTLVNNSNGFLINAKNKKELTENIINTINKVICLNKTEILEKKKFSLKKVQLFSWELIASKHIELMNEINVG